MSSHPWEVSKFRRDDKHVVEEPCTRMNVKTLLNLYPVFKEKWKVLNHKNKIQWVWPRLWPSKIRNQPLLNSHPLEINIILIMWVCVVIRRIQWDKYNIGKVGSFYVLMTTKVIEIFIKWVVVGTKVYIYNKVVGIMLFD